MIQQTATDQVMAAIMEAAALFVKLKRQIGTELRPRKLISIFARDRHHLTELENGQRTRSIAIKQFAARRPCGRADHHQAIIAFQC
jgi:hypothetical protein